MIQLGSLAPQDTDALARGASGFLWHYVDLIDENGNGLVLIWALGLPFLPGLASAQRAGVSVAPASRPSLNLAVYEKGQPCAYLLHELDPDEVAWSDIDGSWTLGQSRIRLHNHADGRQHLVAHLDCPVPGGDGRVRAYIEVTGARCTLDQSRVPLGPSVHAWAPRLTCAEGWATITEGHHPLLELKGRAYYDGNASPTPLHDLGIDRWVWIRTALPGRELVAYLLHAGDGAPTRAVLVEVRPDGAATVTEPVSFEVEAQRRSIWGVTSPTRIRFDLEGGPLHLRLRHTVDDGPFYQRFLVSGHQRGDTGFGVGEVVLPDRIDLAWQRPLVRMRVHRPSVGDSMWLPLFSGPRTGRLQRLIGQVSSPARRAS